jgi:putative ABC transport system substrate-binding protein
LVGGGATQKLRSAGAVGNVTGVSVDAGGDAFLGKRLELPLEAAPTAKRVAYLHPLGERPTNPIPAAALEVAARVGVTLVPVALDGAVPEPAYSRAFALMTAERVDAVFVDTAPVHLTHRRIVVRLATQARLPASCARDHAPAVDPAPRRRGDRVSARLRRSVGLVALLAAAASLCPAPDVAAQSQGKVPVVGRLHPGAAADPVRRAYLAAFRQGLRDLGYIEGSNIVVEPRYAEGNAQRLKDLAAELVSRKVDVIVASGSPAIAAVRLASTTVPIVMAVAANPVAEGFVVSLARPGGNITGLSGLLDELREKQIELIKETFPHVTRIAMLGREGTIRPDRQAALEGAARHLGMDDRRVTVARGDDLEPAFARIREHGAEALVVFGDAQLIDRNRRRIIDLALTHRLPAVAGLRMFAEAGALISYSLDLVYAHRRSAAFVDKILKGAKPADLPVEQPSRFELVVNLKTAKSLGITIPQSILLRADEVIE